MSELDFDEIARLWRKSDASEDEATELLVRRAKRQGRLVGLADIVTGLLFILTTLFGFFMEPGIGTGSLGALLIAATLWANWKRRSLRQMTLSLDTSDRPQFLDVALRHAGGNIRRVSLSLVLFASIVIPAILFKLSYRNGGRLDHPLDTLGVWATSTRGLLVIPFILGIAWFLLLSRRKFRVEYQRIETLRREYQQETEMDEGQSDTDDSL